VINQIKRLSALVLVSLFLVSLALVYWQLVRAPELSARADNPRRVEFERRIARGRILDRAGVELARTDLVGGVAQRHYPYPSLAPVLGYHSLRYGDGGVEAAFNPELRGDAGLDPATALLTRLYHRPQRGEDVMLSIDLDVQTAADRALGDRAGAIVVLDPHDGAVLALASHPTFDPNSFDADFDRLRADPRDPLLNRATQGRYPPGSTFKTVTLAAALDQGLVRPDDRFDDGDRTLWVEGFPIRCNNNPKGVNQFDLAHAYGYSCNVTFAQLALDLGSKKVKDYAGWFMLDREIPFELPVATGQLANNPALIDPVLLANTGFGQGELLLTPLHMALIAATVANDGVMPRPHLLTEVRTPDGTVLRRFKPEPLSTPISPQAARQVRDSMVVAVEDGHARPAAIRGVAVAGKTGTAQVGGDPLPHAWFIGFAPADNPRVAIAVLVEHGGEGSRVAAPLARQVLQAVLRAYPETS
jgi:peptidoglycan glycosyltransferase